MATLGYADLKDTALPTLWDEDELTKVRLQDGRTLAQLTSGRDYPANWDAVGLVWNVVSVASPDAGAREVVFSCTAERAGCGRPGLGSTG
jgi:hypothetical protein